MAASTNKTDTKLPEAVFGVEVSNHALLKVAYEAYLANARTNNAVTLKRGEVSGGGKKPWRQKGTGRARVGSSRNPLWRTGGVVFGPNGSENYSKRLSKTSKRVALRQALSLASKSEKIVIDEPKTSGKTREIVEFLAKRDSAGANILLVVSEKTPDMIRACRNIAGLNLVRATYLSVYHILNADRIIMTPSALDAVVAWLTESQQEESA